MDTSKQTSRTNWRTIFTVVTFAALILLIVSLRKDIAKVINDLGRVNAFALLLMIPFEALNYDAYARFYRSVFSTLHQKVSYRFMYRVNLELNFVNHILPSGGVSGISYFAVRTRSEGVSGAKATLSQVVKLFLLYLSFQPILILGLFLLALRGHVGNIVMLVATALITLLVVGTVLAFYIIEDRDRINNSLTFVAKILNWLAALVRRNKPEVIHIKKAQQNFHELHDNYEVLKKSWRELKTPFVLMMVANATEIAALYSVYIAFGHLVNLGAVILAYAVANFAGLISVLPAGIGVYETLMTAVLSATGIPAELSLPVTLMYRVLNMLVQLAPGYVLYQRALKGGLSSKAG